MQLIADASWTRPYQTCDIGRVVDASLPDPQHRTRPYQTRNIGRVVDASLPDAAATGFCARKRRPLNENRQHGIYSESYR